MDITNEDNNKNLENNTKIIPFEIDKRRKRSSGSSEKCENIDIL